MDILLNTKRDLLKLKEEIALQMQNLEDFRNEKNTLNWLVSFKSEYEAQKRRIIPKNRWIRKLKQQQIHQEIKALRAELEKKYAVSYQIILNNYKYVCPYNVAVLEEVCRIIRRNIDELTEKYYLTMDFLNLLEKRKKAEDKEVIIKNSGTVIIKEIDGQLCAVSEDGKTIIKKLDGFDKVQTVYEKDVNYQSQKILRKSSTYHCLNINDQNCIYTDEPIVLRNDEDGNLVAMGETEGIIIDNFSTANDVVLKRRR